MMMQDDFFKYQAQTTPHPLAIEIAKAKGSYIYDTSDKKYLDFIAGVSACTLGHCHPTIIKAIKAQLDDYLHVMVYGEFVTDPAVQLTKLLASLLPDPLTTTYLTNSGTEAIEGSLKLARRATGRKEILYAEKAYHGNTMGSMSLMGSDYRRKPFEPLIPECRSIRYNDEADLTKITKDTAAVVLETIQGGAGFILPKNNYLNKVRKRCNEVGTLLILDEIQPGFGRTGKLFGFEHFDIVPDILVIGKGMGGGMPIGAFTSSHRLMSYLKDNPNLGHITTFGGHPVIASAAQSTLKVLIESDLIERTIDKENRFRDRLQHSLIKEIRGKGLMLALIFESDAIATEVILKCKEAGLLLFWLLFEKKAVRITPPLTILDSEIDEGCDILLDILDRISKYDNHSKQL
jgi:acetylornithine aminotransferase